MATWPSSCRARSIHSSSGTRRSPANATRPSSAHATAPAMSRQSAGIDGEAITPSPSARWRLPIRPRDADTHRMRALAILVRRRGRRRRGARPRPSRRRRRGRPAARSCRPDNVWNAAWTACRAAADSGPPRPLHRPRRGLSTPTSATGPLRHPDQRTCGRARRGGTRAPSTTPTSRTAWATHPGAPAHRGRRRTATSCWSTRDACRLYELFAAQRGAGGAGARARARSGPALERAAPAGWTSADAAGLPILPGPRALRRGRRRRRIDHALRFTAPRTRAALRLPGAPLRLELVRSRAAADGAARAPQALGRHRGLRPQARVVLTALKRYGMILADNGSPWYVTGAPNAGLGRRRPARARAHHGPRLRGGRHPRPAQRARLGPGLLRGAGRPRVAPLDARDTSACSP